MRSSAKYCPSPCAMGTPAGTWPFSRLEVKGKPWFPCATARFAADELQLAVAQHARGSQTSFHQNLKSVADARGRFRHLAANFFTATHHRREAGDGAAAKIVAVRRSRREGRMTARRRRRAGGIVPDGSARPLQIFIYGVPRTSWSQLLPGKTMTPAFMEKTHFVSYSLCRSPVTGIHPNFARLLCRPSRWWRLWPHSRWSTSLRSCTDSTFFSVPARKPLLDSRFRGRREGC